MTKDTFDDSSEMFFKNDFLGHTRLSNGWHTSFMIRYTTSCNEILNIKRKSNEDSINVLDVGCGEKTFFDFWWKNFDSPGRPRLDYVGLEYRQEVVDYANSKQLKKNSVNKAEVVQYDLNEQSLLNVGRHQKYDVILLQEILEHVPQETSLKLIKEARELVTDRGFVVISSPNPKKDQGQEFVWPENHVQEFSMNEMKKMITDSGLNIRRSNGWLGKARYFKRHINKDQLRLYNDLKSISSGFASSVIAYMYPEIAECYIFICDNKPNISNLFG